MNSQPLLCGRDYSGTKPDRKANDHTGQHPGNIEVFWHDRALPGWNEGWGGEGWYWWSCSPGCLPDSDPVGPFDTSREALEASGNTPEDHPFRGRR